jgi:Protein of unknown function (DUF2971)
MAEIETYAKPIWLYRYRPLGLQAGEGFADDKKFRQEIAAIVDGYIHCSTYEEMNDPMEGFHRSSRKASKHKMYEAFVEQLRTEKLGLGIASLSETWNNELMWAHYADKFQGICICYSMSKLLASIAKGHAFSRIAYGNKPHYLNLPALKDDRERARAVLSTKHLSWAYEREWRIFAPEPGRISHGRGAIRSIFLGARIPAAAQNRIKKELSSLCIPIHATKVAGYTVVKQKT